MSTKYKHSHEVPTDVLAERLSELSDAVGKRGADRDRELTRRVPAELDRDADLVLSEAAQRLVKLEAERDAYRAAEEHQIARRQKMEEERDALAALFVRLQDGATDLIHASSEEEAGDAMELIAECSEKEARSILARRDVLKQAEALEEAAADTVPAMHKMKHWLLSRANDLRQQAEVHQ